MQFANGHFKIDREIKVSDNLMGTENKSYFLNKFVLIGRYKLLT